jgi:hypothetical protein
MEKLKLLLSTKLLDFVEGLPKFRKGRVSFLQSVRENQQKTSVDLFKLRKVPENAQIDLKQITLSLNFEYENFNELSTGLKKSFPKNDKINK